MPTDRRAPLHHVRSLFDLGSVAGLSDAQLLDRFRASRDEAAFASLAGVSPIPASSGNTVRHRLNRGGDRRLNRALHMAVVTRMAYDPTTRAYAERRTAEGLSKKEIRRVLKRYLARQIYRTLTAESRAAIAVPESAPSPA